MLTTERASACRWAELDASTGYLAIISPTGALRVVDVASGALHSCLEGTGADGSKIADFRCACWLQTSATHPHSNAVIAAGSASGHVVAWTVASSEQLWINGCALSGAVAAIAEVQAIEALVAVGTGGYAALLTSATGSIQTQELLQTAQPACCAASSTASVVVVGGTEVHVLEASSLAPIVILSGHSSHVQALACTGDGAYVATCAARDSTVAIYKLSKAGSAKLRIRKAVGHILLSHAPVRLMCCDDAAEIGNDSRTFLLLAITGGGTVEVWRCAKAGKRVEALRVCSVSDASTSDSILAADLASMRSLRIVRGSAAQPQIEVVRLPEERGAHISLKPIVPNGATGNQTVSAQLQSHQAANILGNDNHGRGLTSRQLAGTAKRSAPADDAATLSDEEFERPDALEDGVTLMERLQRLEHAPTAAEVVRSDGIQQLAGDFAGYGTADSLVTLLTQALRAGDKALLDKVLSTGQLSVISNTVARLGSREAIEVFGEAVDRLHSRPARAAMLLPWLRAVLLSHSSYLAVSGVAKGHVSTLQQLVSARVALLEPMLALRGRIDFVLANAATQRAQTAGMSDKPPLVVVDAARLKAHSMADFWAGNLTDSPSDEDGPAEDPYRQTRTGPNDSNSDDSVDVDEMETDTGSSND